MLWLSTQGDELGLGCATLVSGHASWSSAASLSRESVNIPLEREEDVDMSELKTAVEEAPVVKLVNLILGEAIMRGASDIHFEPYEKSLRVRYRIDGVLYDVM